MSILVTGGAGFIGSNLVSYILECEIYSEQKVVVLDSITYAGNVENLPKHSNLFFVKGDVRDRELVNSLVADVDQVFHLAAESHVDRSISNSQIFVETNVMGTLNVLQAVRDFGKRLVQVSTDEVYGSLESGFADENYPMNPSSPYSASKAAADLLVNSYHKTFGVNAVITRCANNYGLNQYPEKLVPLVINRAYKNQAIPVYGDGSNVRDWIHVKDHCAGLVLAMTRGIPGQIYNFGNVDHLSNLEIVRKILGILNRPETLISFVDDRLGHDYRYAINSDKAIRELGWHPTHKLETSLPDLVKAYVSKF